MVLSAHGRGANCSRAPSAAGLILFDAEKKPVYFDSEALQILTYPLRFKNIKHPETLLPDLLRIILPERTPSSASLRAIEFHSGRRHYVGRLFCLAHNSKGNSGPITGLLMERSEPRSISLSTVAERFRLTPREQQTVALLMVGLTSKEIASQLKVSTNTVKTFVRLIKTKMAVPTRAGIVGKLVGA